MADEELLRLPASKNQLSALGRRLAAGSAAPGDDDLYVEMLDVYDRALRHVRARVEQVDWAHLGLSSIGVTGRTKTLDTLVQKLRRSPATQLPYVRDIAGIRLVSEMTLEQQRAVADTLCELFDVGPEAVVDRRRAPASGYRALHVAVRIDGIPVEIQIRTRLQHLWAEVFERLADRLGRQIRYGEPPDASGTAPLLHQRSPAETVEEMIRLSVEQIAEVENVSSSVWVITTALDDQSPVGADIRAGAGMARPPVLAAEQLDQLHTLQRMLTASHRELEQSLLRIDATSVVEADLDASRSTVEGS